MTRKTIAMLLFAVLPSIAISQSDSLGHNSSFENEITSVDQLEVTFIEDTLTSDEILLSESGKQYRLKIEFDLPVASTAKDLHVEIASIDGVTLLLCEEYNISSLINGSHIQNRHVIIEPNLLTPNTEVKVSISILYANKRKGVTCSKNTEL